MEVDVAPGLPSFTTVGLPDSAVHESRDRVRAAIRNASLEFPMDRITVNLAPAEVRKVGTAFDLPMALGILIATETLKPERLEHVAVLGELSLDGRIQPVRGVLPIALHCRRRGVHRLLVPAGNAEEAAVVGGITVIPLDTLYHALEYLNGEREIAAYRPGALRRPADADSRWRPPGASFANPRRCEAAVLTDRLAGAPPRRFGWRFSAGLRRAEHRSESSAAGSHRA